MAFKKVTEESRAEAQKELEKTHRHEVSVRERFNDDQLREIASYEDAMKLAASAYGQLEKVSDLELGNGFKLLPGKDKSRLVGLSFVILHFQFNEGEFSDEFVSVTLVTQNGDRLIMNDGGTGICAQLKEISKTGRYGGIAVPHGLRKSEYPTCFECGKPRKRSQTECPKCGDDSERRGEGATYYLDTSE